MIKETLTFDIEIEKYKFYYHKSLIYFFVDVDIINILASNKTSLSEKHYK